MGFIQVLKGSISGMASEQWIDYLQIPANVSPSAALVPASLANKRGSDGVITNGTKIVVEPGYGLITLVNGRITGFIAEAGVYTFVADDPNAQSIFSGAGIVSTLIGNSWERFKFGGQAASAHLALYVNLKEITGNRFGTQSEIYWDDAFLNTQVGALCRGTYTLKIIDPILFINAIVPANYLQPGAPSFDFSDLDNPVSGQLFSELVGSLAPAFSKYVNDPQKGNRISKIQADSVGFAKALGQAVEENYQWTSRAGLVIPSASIISIEYDQNTRALLEDVKKADALSGNRGNSFMQQAAARGLQASGENAGSANMAMFGFGANAAGGVISGLQQPATQASTANAPVEPAKPEVDIAGELEKAKGLLEKQLITQDDYDALKKRLLGL